MFFDAGVQFNPAIVIAWIVLGLLVGALAQVPLGRGYSLVGDLLLGFVGALVGGLLVALLYDVQGEGGLSSSLVAAFVGAVIFLAGRRAVADRPELHVERPSDVTEGMPD